jgi:hypothetical protein
MKFQNAILFFILASLSACHSQMTKFSEKSDTTKVQLSGTYANALKYSGSTEKLTLLEILGHHSKIEVDTVELSLTGANELIVSFFDPQSLYQNKTEQIVREGGYDRKGRFVIFLRNEKINIPLFYSNYKVYKIVFDKMGNNDILITTTVDNRWNVFLFANGKKQNDKFTLIKIPR